MTKQLLSPLSRFLLLGSLLVTGACQSPHEGPDKTIAGAALGAAWGAGAGAVIGNQLEYTPSGEGAAIGAGFGLVGGGISGLMYDSIEDTQIDQEKQLASLRIQNMTNSQQLGRLQGKLDHAITSDIAGGVYQVFFDPDATSLRTGATANLEVIADSIRMSPHGYRIHVMGHSDDSGTPTYNQQVAESRARAVSAYLASRGVSVDQIDVKSFGSQRPIATNATPTGRQLNRRVDVYISRR